MTEPERRLTVERDPEVRTVNVLQVVFLRGDGSMASPVRRIVQYRDLEGQLLAEHDVHPPHHLMSDEVRRIASEMAQDFVRTFRPDEGWGMWADWFRCQLEKHTGVASALAARWKEETGN